MHLYDAFGALPIVPVAPRPCDRLAVALAQHVREPPTDAARVDEERFAEALPAGFVGGRDGLGGEATDLNGHRVPSS